MEWVVLAVVLVVVLVVAVAGFVVPRRRGGGLPPAPEQAVPPLRTGTQAPVEGEPEARAEPETEPEPRPGEGTLVDTTGPGLEVPEPTAGRLVRLRSRLSRSQNTLGKGLLDAAVPGAPGRGHLGGGRGHPADRRRRRRADPGARRAAADPGQGARHPLRGRAARAAREELVTALQPDMDRTLHTVPHSDGHPAVVLVVGVNGTGKTTTTGKLARVLVADGRTVVLGAADTFRAAAADQLQTWGERVGARTVRGPEGGDPASVAFDAVKEGIETEDPASTRCSSTPPAGCTPRPG